MVVARSWARVERERSESSGVLVSPWPRESSERTPAAGRSLRIEVARRAKERPEEPAPWWVTKRGPVESGGVR